MEPDQLYQHGRQLLQAGDSSDHLIHIHGWLMAASWGFLIPIGVTLAIFRSVRGMRPWWFYLHSVIQTLGFLLSLAGIGVGAQLNIDQQLQRRHRAVGITVTVLAGVQWLTAVFWRPDRGVQLRRWWNVWHHSWGRIAFALAIANIYVGLCITQPGTRYFVGQTVVFGVLFALVVLKNDIEYLMKPWTPATEEDADMKRLLTGGQPTGTTYNAGSSKPANNYSAPAAPTNGNSQTMV